MKNLIIIGGGGMGREVYDLAKHCVGYNKDYLVKGFIDDNLDSLAGLKHSYPPVIDTIRNYQVQKDDVFICSIGDVRIKKICTEIIQNKGGEFISLVHPSAHINETATIGKGCLVFLHTLVGSEAFLGNHTLIQSFAVIGHDAIIGDFSRIDVKVVCVGGVKIGSGVTIHTSSIISHNVEVEDNAKVGAASFVIKKVKSNTTVFGNPAREL